MLRRLFKHKQAPALARIRRRQALVSVIIRRLSVIIVVLFLAGYAWMLSLPSPQLGRGTYIDENALQPGQVNTLWNWEEVHDADFYLEKLERLRDNNASSAERAEFFAREFRVMGISALTQSYTFDAITGVPSGINAYAAMTSPRQSGTEAIIVSASWLSRTGEGDGTLNLRGVATVLALAKYLKRYSLWAKDLVFVVSDGYMEGMHAFLSAYHGSVQTNLCADAVELSSGVVWTALNIDYPGHSFSHLGIFYEGLNGRLPNQDLINSVQRIAQSTAGVPIVLYDLAPLSDTLSLPTWIASLASKLSDAVSSLPGGRVYLSRAQNVGRHVSYQAFGRASGVHGLFHQFRIDAITIFAVPATGPHGFHAIGKVVESSLRTANNLLERLHASFFFYILTDSDQFLKIGNYLPSVILVSVALMFCGLREWSNAGWRRDGSFESSKENILSEKMAGDTQHSNAAPKAIRSDNWISRPRPVRHVISIMSTTHIIGGVLFFAINNRIFVHHTAFFSPVLSLLLASIPPVFAYIAASQDSVATDHAKPSVILRAFNLCVASTFISIMVVLNFSMAALYALVFGISLVHARPSHSVPVKFAKYAVYASLAAGWLVLCSDAVVRTVRDWEILSVWFLPVFCVVYVPLMLQAAIVVLLQP
ncbi:Gaa1-domain-containing protein [Fistulina hepatica ATCC 64428]|nr:Gaa1-domain-containing protein [Fistulina hepatica ATCC 64428]